MSIKTLAGLAGVAAFAATATAQFTASQFAPRDLDEPTTSRGAAGDTASTALTVFGPTMSGFLAGPIDHTIGSTETFPVNTAVDVTSSVVDNGDGTRTLTINWMSNNGAALFGPNAFGTEPITTLGFELGENNAGMNTVDPTMYAGIADPDTEPDGVFEAGFELLDASGGSLFSGNFFVTDTGTGFSGVTFIGAGGADLGNFNIGGGTATITYFIPAPGAAALFGLGGLAAARRRR